MKDPRDLVHSWALPLGNQVTLKCKGTEILVSGTWSRGQGSPIFPLTQQGSGPAEAAASHAVLPNFLQALSGSWGRVLSDSPLDAESE